MNIEDATHIMLDDNAGWYRIKPGTIKMSTTKEAVTFEYEENGWGTDFEGTMKVSVAVHRVIALGQELKKEETK